MFRFSHDDPQHHISFFEVLFLGEFKTKSVNILSKNLRLLTLSILQCEGRTPQNEEEPT